MIFFKKLDLGIQVAGLVAMATSWIIFFTNKSVYLWPYFALGGWQLSSALIHALYLKSLVPGSARKTYWKGILLVALANLILLPIWPLVLIATLLVTPLLALFYAWISFQELRRLQTRLRTQLR